MLMGHPFRCIESTQRRAEADYVQRWQRLFLDEKKPLVAALVFFNRINAGAKIKNTKLGIFN